MRIKFTATFLVLLLTLSLQGYAKQSEEDNLKLIIFQGSDWCSKCIKLEKTILSDSTFQKYLNQNNIDMELVDFPQRKKMDEIQKEKNKSIAEKYDFSGSFPTILLVNGEKNIVSSIVFNNQKVADFVVEIEQKLQSIK